MTITLIGYRGTGKTTVGVALAERLGWNFIDLDPGIEQQAGMSIAEIFQRHGEPFFRHMESHALQQALTHNRSVVSPGGGSILDPSNRAAMKAAGPVIWLVASVETISDRLSHDPSTTQSRPALTGGNVLTEIQDVLNQRLPYYENAATHIISTDNRNPAAIVDEMISQLALSPS